MQSAPSVVSLAALLSLVTPCAYATSGSDPTRLDAGECKVSASSMLQTTAAIGNRVNASEHEADFEEDRSTAPKGHRVACEHVGHGTYPDCMLQRNGVCYGKVKYGHAPSNRWTGWKNISGSFSCVSGTFGGDPAYGTAKECICDGTDSPPCPSDFRAACENPRHGSFRTCTSPRKGSCYGQVKLGHGSRWSAWKSWNGSFDCNNGFFGGDPAPNQAKECICRGCDSTTTTTTTPSWTKEQSQCLHNCAYKTESVILYGRGLKCGKRQGIARRRCELKCEFCCRYGDSGSPLAVDSNTMMQCAMWKAAPWYGLSNTLPNFPTLPSTR